MGCSIVGCVLSISKGAAIAIEDHGLPQECLLDSFVKTIDLFEETSNDNKS